VVEVLVGLLIIVVAAFVVRRLLGIDRGRWFVTLAAVVAGEAGAGAILQSIYEDPADVPAVGWIGLWALVVVFAMLVVVLTELLTAPGAMARRRGVPRPIRNAREMVRRARRYIEVGRIVVRRGLLRRGGGQGEEVRGSRLGRSLRETFEDAGGLFVKVGQAMAQQPQLVTPAVASELATLHERAAPADPAAAREVITEELGAPEEVFAEIGWIPLGSASIAQTYLARLPDQREVVVKVQRPGVAASIERDLDILYRLARRLHRRTTWAGSLGLRELVAGFDERTREELDFRIEGASGLAARRSLRDSDPICVPDVLEGFTTSRILVQERAPGESVAIPGAFDGWDAERRRALADGLLALMLRQMLAGEQFHADPHPGNVFLCPDGRLALIDFGAVGRLDPYERAGLVDLLRGLHGQDPSLVREGVLRIGTLTGSVDEDALDRELSRLLTRSFRPDGTLNPDLFEDLLFVVREFGIVLPRSTTTLFRTLVTLLGTLEVIAPGYQIVDAAPRVGGELIREQAVPQSPSELVMTAALDNATIMRRLPGEVDAIARRLLHGDLRTRVSLLSEPEDVRVARGMVNRLVMGLVASALALASAVMLAADSPPVEGVRLVNLLGGIGLFFSVLVLLRLLVQILRERE
jgi:ubiquinone biosynthesis protein